MVAFGSISLSAGSAETSVNAAPQAPVQVETTDVAEPAIAASQTTEEVYGTVELPPFVSTAERYKSLLTPREKLRFQIHFIFAALDANWLGNPNAGAFVVTPGRVPQRPNNVAYTVQLIDQKDIRDTPAVSLAGVLQSMPDFGLSGRTGRSSALLSDQGVVLRGVGAKATGARVLLDGVPLNDPFGGWVAWPLVPREGLIRAEVVPGGGSTVWGDGALGGVVQLFTIPANGKIVVEQGTPNDGGPPDPSLTKHVVRQATELTTSFGDYGTRSAEIVSAQPTDTGVLQFIAQDYSTDGYPVVASDSRGPIDRNAWGRDGLLQTLWRQALGKNIELTVTIRDDQASCGEGTPDQQDHLRGDFISVAIAGAPSTAFSWRGLVFVQDQSYARTFTSVGSTRSFETPVINEFAVPATAFGTSWSGVWRHANLARTVAGFDLHYASGETRENLGYSNRAFTREYMAGGDQGMIGIFVSQEQRLSSTVRATFGARVDAWRDADGHQRVVDSSSGVVLSDDRYTVDSDAEISPSAGVVWQPEKELRFHANAQESSRSPTLGERYETYGHGFIVTEPNPDLRTAQNTSVEFGAEDRPAASVSLGATAFLNELRDALGNLRIQRGSGGFPMVDALPSGYFVQQRINLDRVRVQGLKLSASWQPGTAFSLEASLLFNDPTILHSAIAPELEGRQMAGVSRRIAILSAKWQASKDLSFRLRVRSLGRQFVDDENTLRLGDAIVADVGANYAVTEHAELYLTAENLTDAAVETNRSTNGVVCIGAPRLILGGLRWKW